MVDVAAAKISGTGKEGDKIRKMLSLGLVLGNCQFGTWV